LGEAAFEKSAAFWFFELEEVRNTWFGRVQKAK
jgi:hypothetical protein